LRGKGIRVAIDCDDAAVELKDAILEHLKSRGVEVADINYAGGKAVAYPDIGYNLALKVQAGEYDRAILLCGTGIGMCIVANKVEGVYAAACHDVYSAERLRKSNNAQILTMGARVIGRELAKKVVDAWLASEFEGGRSTPKVERIRELERKSFGRREHGAEDNQ
jgi:ribose 5-phosphate isomerase B